MVKQLSIGVIGIGFGQHVHIPAFRAHQDCEVTAVSASQYDRASGVASRLGVPLAFGDWREMVADPRIDAITIAVPPRLNAEIAVAALARGKAVFCEKPLAVSEEAAEEMVAAADRAGVANMVDFEFTEIEPWRQAKLILDQGGIGSLRHVAVSWNVETYSNRKGLLSWKTSFEEGGGTLYLFVSHVFYYLEWFLGRIARLSASMFKAPSDRRTADTVAMLCAECSSGVVASLSISSHAFLGYGHRVEFFGDEGTLVLENPTHDYVSGFRLLHGTRAGNRLEVVSQVQEQASPLDGRIPAVARLVERFVHWIRVSESCSPNFRDGLRVQRLLGAARKSHELKSWVGGLG